MTSAPPVARTMNGDQRFEMIVATAERMIHERGFMAVSIRDLAASVGIKVASLYYYFPSKDQILYLICKRHMDRLLSVTKESVAAASGGPREQLSAAIYSGVLCHIQDQCSSGVMIAESRHLEGDGYALLRGMSKDYEGIFLGIVREGLDRGDFQADDAVMATYVILGAMTRIPVWYRAGGRLDPEDVARNYTVSLMRSLGADPVLPPAGRDLPGGGTPATGPTRVAAAG